MESKREKTRYIRELIITSLFIAVLVLILSYVSVRTTLNISGFSSSSLKVPEWSVNFDSVRVYAKEGTAEIISEPVIKGTDINYEIRLKKAGDSVTMVAIVKNKGGLDARLYSYDLFGIPSNYEDNITYTVTSDGKERLNEGIVLKGNSATRNQDRYMTVYITIAYEKTIFEQDAGSKQLNLALSLNFVQNCDKCDNKK